MAADPWGRVSRAEQGTGRATHCFWAWSMRLLRLVICKQHRRLTCRVQAGPGRGVASCPVGPSAALAGLGALTASRLLWLEDPWACASDLLLMARAGDLGYDTQQPRSCHLPSRLCGVWGRGPGAEARLASRAPTWWARAQSPAASQSSAQLLSPADCPGGRLGEGKARPPLPAETAGQPQQPPGGRQGGGGRREEKRKASGVSAPPATDTCNDPGFRHARGPPCMNTQSLVQGGPRLLTTWPASPLWPGRS